MEHSIREKQELLEQKKQEIISKFSLKLTKGDFLLNPTLHTIVMSLTHGNDPYSIIEQLLINQEQLIKEMHQMQQRGSSFKPLTNLKLGEPHKK
jgi:hypothetical protein